MFVRDLIVVSVAQLVRAPGCGPGGRGFEPHRSPHKNIPMENKFLIDLSIKYGLDDQSLSKVVDMCYQLDYNVIDDREFQRAATYICSMNLLKMPPEDLIEEMKRKGFGPK